MTEKLDALDMNRWIAWNSEIGDYAIWCLVHENPHNHFTFVVKENGTELERVNLIQQASDQTDMVTETTERLRLQYNGRFNEKVLRRR